jgi:signal transduction histidine kinase
MTADIRGTLRAGIDEIGDLARAARDSVADPGASFAAIECAGRSVLDSMRHVVGTLRDAPTDPEPGLAELTGLLASATSADARLSVTGPARPLPASIELAGYRIVEQLLTVLRDDPATRVEVRVRFAADCLELRIAGPPAANDDMRRVRSVVQARLALYGGTVDIDDGAARRAARIRLPLVTSHV